MVRSWQTVTVNSLKPFLETYSLKKNPQQATALRLVLKYHEKFHRNSNELKNRNSNTKAMRMFATHSDLSVEITDPGCHLKPWSKVWSILEKLHQQLSIRSFFEKVKLRKLHVTGSHTQKFDLSVMFFDAQCLRSLHSKNRENEQVPATLSHIKKLLRQSCLFRLRRFAVQWLRSLNIKERENEQVPTRKRPFWPLRLNY